ncbi:CLUMA_CG002042, isoform A [Clunio marinus]|uniref:CLUMA_CG002042, isoform A n=1 Tax=Clunio marinus TaxID=568069 RepID=A0A1J1HP63_9DIPT|nr:CLUMA_CG002042, isoform A [Clunio marinus]
MLLHRTPEPPHSIQKTCQIYSFRVYYKEANGMLHEANTLDSFIYEKTKLSSYIQGRFETFMSILRMQSHLLLFPVVFTTIQIVLTQA